MKQEYFELVKIILQAVILIITTILVPTINKYIHANLSEKELKDFLYFTKLGVGIAEQIYKEKGKGVLKKEYVIKYLNNLNNKTINFTESQVSALVDLVVAEFNKNGWDKVVLNA